MILPLAGKIKRKEKRKTVFAVFRFSLDYTKIAVSEKLHRLRHFLRVVVYDIQTVRENRICEKSG